MPSRSCPNVLLVYVGVAVAGWGNDTGSYTLAVTGGRV